MVDKNQDRPKANIDDLRTDDGEDLIGPFGHNWTEGCKAIDKGIAKGHPAYRPDENGYPVLKDKWDSIEEFERHHDDRLNKIDPDANGDESPAADASSGSDDSHSETRRPQENGDEPTQNGSQPDRQPILDTEANTQPPDQPPANATNGSLETNIDTPGSEDRSGQPLDTVDDDSPRRPEIDEVEKNDFSTPKRDEDESISDFIDRVDSSQEYIKITPVRCDLNAETIARELYGLHEYGGGKKLPLDLEKHIGMVEGVSNFEFLIHKPEGRNEFEFYIGPGERGDVDCDRLSSNVRSQYPEEYKFERETFDISEGFDEVPHVVRFNGEERKKKDWMTRLVGLEDNDIERSPLANLLETAVQCDGEVLYQVVMEPRQDWTRKANQQKMLLKRNVHSMPGMFFQTAMDAIFGVSKGRESARQRGDTPNQIGGTISDREANGIRPGTDRMAQIDLKDPANTYNVCVRAATTEKSTAKSISDGLNHLSGYFYKISGEYLGKDEAEFSRMLNHGITYPAMHGSFKRTKSMLVANTEELANLITVPPINHLPKASKAGSGGAPKSQSPLTSPNEDMFDKFDHGVAIGEVKTEIRDDDSEEVKTDLSNITDKNVWWDKIDERETIQLNASHLSTHYLRAAGTGHGKTVATINDALTAHEYLDGPLIIVDPSGGDMCRNYLSCHRTLFGGTDDVEYIQVPEKEGEVPCMPFFDIRPLTEKTDLARPVAVQQIIDHYFEVLNYALGESTVQQAFVANEILTSLIKAMFDEEYGKDHFSIGDLLAVAQDYAEEGKKVAENQDGADRMKALPQTSDPQLRNMLESHFEKDPHQFTNTTDAVLNRIRKLKERDFIWSMMSVDIPDSQWSDKKDWYKPDVGPLFDLDEVFNSNKAILIDTGNIQGESSKMFTVLFLSHLWSSARSLYTPDKDNYCANVIIEESAPIARSDIVVENLLPEGRKFGLSMGLIMQYPEQVLGNDPDSNSTAYSELLNNVKTKLIGNISIDDDLSDSLFHEDLDNEQIKDRISGLVDGEWVCELPSTEFLGDKAEILTMKALPVPPGHSGGSFDVPSDIEHIREHSRNNYCVGPDHDYISTTIENTFAMRSSDVPTPSDEGDNNTSSKPNLPADLTEGEHEFLKLVANALSDGTSTMYNLSESMTKLAHEEDHAEDLIEKDYLTDHRVGNQKKYYNLTEKAKDVSGINYQPASGGERGSESFEHRFGVRVTATYLEQEGYNVTLYHNPEGDDHDEDGEGSTFDIYAEDTRESPDPYNKIVEVETSTDVAPHVSDDFEKLAEGYGDAIWVVENFEKALELVDKLVEEGCLSDDIDQRVRSFEDLNDQLNEDGMSKIIGLNDLQGRI